MSNEEAAVLVDEMRYHSIDNKEDFTFETVLSSDFKLTILEKVKSEDYFIKCIFVLTSDVSVNISRVNSRVASGGHDVDKGKIISRYRKSIDNIKKLVQMCDILHVYDNTDTPTRIIRKHKDDISIYPSDFWNAERIYSLF